VLNQISFQIWLIFFIFSCKEVGLLGKCLAAHENESKANSTEDRLATCTCGRIDLHEYFIRQK